jgi:hypothetical protein
MAEDNQIGMPKSLTVVTEGGEFFSHSKEAEELLIDGGWSLCALLIVATALLL